MVITALKLPNSILQLVDLAADMKSRDECASLTNWNATDCTAVFSSLNRRSQTAVLTGRVAKYSSILPNHGNIN